MSNATVKLTGSGAFQDIGTISTSTSGLAGNMQSVNQILDVGLRNTTNIKDSFIRVSDLTGLGLATLNGNVLTVADLVSATSFSVNGTNGVDALVFSGATVSVSGGTATITVTGGGGTGTVTSVGITSTTLTVSGTVTTSGNLTVNLSSTQVSDLALAATALQPVTGLAGSYTNANITLNSSGQITVAANGSGGGGSSVFNVTPDTHTNAPTYVANDEFEGTSLDTAGTRFSGATAWSTSLGSGTVSLDKGALNLFSAPNSNSSTRAVSLIYQHITTSTTAYRFRCKMSIQSSTNGNLGGIALYESSTGKAVCWSVLIQSSHTAFLFPCSYTNLTTFGADITFVQTGSGAPAYTNQLDPANYELSPRYYEIELASGQIIVRLSRSGFEGSFVQILSIPMSTYFSAHPDSVGYLVDASGGADNTRLYVDWHRQEA